MKYNIALLKANVLRALKTYNLYSTTEMYKNYTDRNMPLMHRYTNN